MADAIRARLTCYSNGTVEMGWCRQPEALPNILSPSPDPPPPSYSRDAFDDRSEGYAIGSLDRAARRAKGVIRKVCTEHRFDHMVTLTTRANQDDFDVTLAMLRHWLRLVRKVIPGYIALAVPERQDRGAWHWHVAVAGWQNLYVLRHAWGVVCDHYLHGGGNVDIQAPRGKGSHSLWSSGRLAHYLSKYLSKALEEEREGLKGRHRYVAPLGIKTWAEFTVELPGDLSTYELMCAFSDFIGERVIDVLWAPDSLPGIGWCRST